MWPCQRRFVITHTARHPHEAASSYARRLPEETVLYRTRAAHWAEFCERAEEAAGLPRFVQREVDESLRCGLLEYGRVRVGCERCGLERLVAFSCKRRGFCLVPRTPHVRHRGAPRFKSALRADRGAFGTGVPHGALPRRAELPREAALGGRAEARGPGAEAARALRAGQDRLGSGAAEKALGVAAPPRGPGRRRHLHPLPRRDSLARGGHHPRADRQAPRQARPRPKASASATGSDRSAPPRLDGRHPPPGGRHCVAWGPARVGAAMGQER
jgi:hypothetical protein